jgi:protein TIF31
LSTYGIQKLSLLRSFCLKTGVQILLREYQFNKMGGAGKLSGNTFNQEDVLNVFPIVKHIDPKVRIVRIVYACVHLRSITL